MDWEPIRPEHGRRSRLEMVCDILWAVSAGAQGPTRIMQMANLTWTDLLTYLEALLRNQHLEREAEGGRVTYRLTPKGREMLNSYSKLREEGVRLGLQTITPHSVSKALKGPILSSQDDSVLASLAKRLGSSGFKVIDKNAVGKSGETHTFSLLCEAGDGSKHGYVILKSVDESQVLKLFVTQLDADVFVHAMYTEEVSEKARELAKLYSIGLEEWREAVAIGSYNREIPTNTSKLEGKSTLLEVDPSVNYERIVRDLTTEFIRRKHGVSAFTWRGSPVYESLSDLLGAKLFTMSPLVSYPKPGERDGEVLVPEKDLSVMLDVLEKTMNSEPGNLLIVFDSLSDLIISNGFQESYEFLKHSKEITSKPRVSSVFIMKRGAHDYQAISLIKGLFRDHLSYDSSGLKATRET